MKTRPMTKPTVPVLHRRLATFTKMRELRVAKGLSQLELSVLVGIAHTYLSTLERAPSRMTPAVAEKVAEVLGCDPDEIRT